MTPDQKVDRLFQSSTFEFTEEQKKEIELRWKSDVDEKLDKMIAFMDKTESFLDMLILREASRAALHKAIIEKTLSGIAGAAVLALLALLWAGVKTEYSEFINAMKGGGR